MHDLIKITERNGIQVVSGRELYDALEIKTKFIMWMPRMIEYGFTQDIDYQVLLKFGQNSKGGPNNVLDDYAISLDMAKQIAMIQRTEKGKEIRQYFIDVEKKYQAVPVRSALDDDDILAKGILIAQRRISDQSALIQRQANYIKEVQPKIEYTEKVLTSQTCWTSTTIAKDMGMKSAQQLHKRLNAMGIIFKDSDGIWVPYSKYADKNLTETRTSTYTDSHGKLCTSITTVWNCIIIYIMHSN